MGFPPGNPKRGHQRPRRITRSTGIYATAAVIALAGLGWWALAARHSPDPTSAASARRHSPSSTSMSPTRLRPPAAGRAAPAVLQSPGSAPSSPPARVCGNAAILGQGPASPPPGAVVIKAGNDSSTFPALSPNKTYWFAPGIHTIGTGAFDQIAPDDGDTFIGAPGAVLDGQHRNLYAFTQQAKNVTISSLTIQGFGAPGDNGGQGVVNHDSGTNWHIDHVTVQDSAGAGVMLGSQNVLSWSCLKDNGEYGFQGLGNVNSGTDPVNITVDHDEITGNNTDNWEVRRSGCGCSGGAKFWRVDGATITSNYVHGNHGPGLWADTDNRGFEVADNYFADNEGEGFIYEISYNLRLASNTFLRNGLVEGPQLAGFPVPAVYVSESGSDPRVPGPYGTTLAITGNDFINNWSGVVLWENADRFCNSPANSSSFDCTLVSRLATLHSCDAANISRPPYYNDCRWKTQNVLVSHNEFILDPAAIGPDCKPTTFCGVNGIFSQVGSSPSWSPYRGTVVENHITSDQDNHFRSNVYRGPWLFMAHQQGNIVSWDQWRAAPYDQDAGSTLR